LIQFSLRDFDEKDCSAVSGVFVKLPKLTHLNYSVHLFDAVADGCEDAVPKVPHKVYSLSNLKTIVFKSFVKTGWYDMNPKR